MSLYDFRVAKDLVHKDVPFYALIMAAIMKADTRNTMLLQTAWPEIWRETEKRYNSPGDLLEEECSSERSRKITR